LGTKLTSAPAKSSHLGWKKYLRPSAAPSKVKARARNAKIIKYGKVAVM